MQATRKYRITLIGEKDNGKSTLLGNLLLITGTASKERIEDAKGDGAGNRFEPAFLLDNFSEERLNGLTLDTTKATVVYKNAMLEFTDVPGHEELIRNMLSGAAEAEGATFVVSAKEDEGFTAQAKRHLDVAALLNFRFIIIAVNKMDAVRYSKARFEAVRQEVRDYLSVLGFEGKASFVPVSAYDGDNLVSVSKNMPWYHGKTVIDEAAEDARATIRRKGSSKLRILVQGEVQDRQQHLLLGKICSGKAVRGTRLSIEPGHGTTRITKLFVDGERAAEAGPGRNIAIALGGNAMPKKGSVLYASGFRPHSLKVVKAKLFIMNDTGMVKPNNATIRINNVLLKVDDLSILKSRGDCNIADAQLTLMGEYPLERFETVPELGRFLLYNGKQLAGIGVVQ
jgi:translation elongation factor EF-1alpha